jgi:hypothetical protein
VPQNPRIDQRAIDKLMKDLAKDFQRASRKHPIRVPVTAEASTARGAVNSTDAVESTPHLALLLLWLDGHAQRHPAAYVDVAQFVEEHGLPGTDASVLAVQLEQRGLVTIARSMTSDTDVHLTDEGRVEVHRLKQLQRDHAARHRYAADALLRWLYTTAHDQRPVNPVGFLHAPEGHFAGDALSPDELHRAIARLVQAGLAERIDTEPATIAITPDGHELVLSGGTVSDHLNRPQVGDSYTFNNSQGIVAGPGNRVQQTNSFGLDASALRTFAEVVKQFAPTFGMTPDQQAELVHDAELLGEETSSQAPEPGRIRAAYERVLTGLRAITTASAGVALVVQQGEEAYHTVFGS